MSSLTNTKINVTYTGVLHSNGAAIPQTGLQFVYDGAGNQSSFAVGRDGQGATVSGRLNCTTLNVTNPIDIINLIYPVGSVILNITGTSPQSYLPGTSWVLISQGRYLVGVGTGTDSRGTPSDFGYGNAYGVYNNVTTFSLPYHYHITGGFNAAKDDNWVPIYHGQANENMYGRWVPGDSGNNNFQTIGPTYSTRTTGPKNGAAGAMGSGDGGTTNTFHTAPPGFGVAVWQRTS